MRFATIILALSASVVMAAPKNTVDVEAETASPGYSGSSLSVPAKTSVASVKTEVSNYVESAKSSASSVVEDIKTSATQSVYDAKKSAFDASISSKSVSSIESEKASYTKYWASYSSSVDSSMAKLPKPTYPTHGQVITCDNKDNNEVRGACCESWKTLVEDKIIVKLAPEDCKEAVMKQTGGSNTWHCMDMQRPFGVCCDKKSTIKECTKAKPMYNVSSFDACDKQPIEMKWTLEKDLSQHADDYGVPDFYRMMAGADVN